MKTKVILFLAISALVTLSFTFATVSNAKVEKTSAQKSSEEPAGGFVSEDKF